MTQQGHKTHVSPSGCNNGSTVKRPSNPSLAIRNPMHTVSKLQMSTCSLECHVSERPEFTQLAPSLVYKPDIYILCGNWRQKHPRGPQLPPRPAFSSDRVTVRSAGNVAREKTSSSLVCCGLCSPVCVSQTSQVSADKSRRDG